METIPRTRFFGTPLHGINDSFHASSSRNDNNNNILSFPPSSSPPILRILNTGSSSASKDKRLLSEEIHKLTIPESQVLVTHSNLRFDRTQPSDEDPIPGDRLDFGNYLAREAFLDEEYWMAAWMRAESHWEGKGDRFAQNHKIKFADQEFNAMKRRRKAILGPKCICIIAVKKPDKNVKRTVLSSVVGTLDVSIGALPHGQSYPREHVKSPLFFSLGRQGSSRYGYISNLCVAKFARRRGIATGMLKFAIRSAQANGAEEIFVHVHKHNVSAQQLYQKIGFEVVEDEECQTSDGPTFLLRLKA